MKFIKEDEIYLLKYLVVFLSIVILGVFFYVEKPNLGFNLKPLENEKTDNVPQKIDFGVNTPTDFPGDIPIEKGSKVEQSYGLNYAGQEQLTIVFFSTKTVNENYTLYSNFLEKQNWTISNKYESPKVSSLYGVKEGNDINVTISESLSAGITTKSSVSISILKK